MITFSSPTYNPSLIDIYTVTISYAWNQYEFSKFITVTLIDPCIAGVVFPASIANKSNYLSDANTSMNLGPTIATAYQSVCVYSISIVSTKTVPPDTSANLVAFTTMINAS